MNEGRRTQAIRAPAAGGFTPPTSLAASNPCLNCGTNIQLAYCPECGQRETDPDPTLEEFLHELSEEFLNRDGKLARTIRMLVSKPGALTREYVDGRRARYVSPLRLYLGFSAIFFVLNALVPQRSVTRSGWQRIVAGVAPPLMFVLVPLFAALVAFVYRDRRRNYPLHLAFALHVYAVLFIAFTLAIASTVFPWGGVRIAYQALLLGAVIVYAIRAARVVYERR